MKSPTTDNADLVRGLLIALGLITLFAAAFLLVARNGHSHGSDLIDRFVTMMTPPAPKPEKKPPPAAAAERAANPSATGGAPVAGDGAPSAPSDAGSRAAGASGARPAANTAAQALQQVLRDYRNDPTKTATITISSTGRVSRQTAGPLTGHDGLPMDALNGSTVLTGGVPSGSAAR